MASIKKYTDDKGPKWRVFLDTTRRGKRYRPSRTFRDYASAKAYKLELEQQQAAGVRPSKTQLGAYLDTWRDNKVALGAIRPNTLSGYNGKLDSMKMAMGSIELHDLTADDVEAWMRGMLSGQFAVSGRPLSPSTVRQSRTILVSALGDAVRKRLLPYNVAEAAAMPRVPRKTKKPSWDMEHVRAFLEELDAKTDYGNFFRYIALSGCRRSEAGGLLATSVDFANREVHIDNSLIRQSVGGRSQYTLSEPKTESSRRSLPMSAPLEHLLRSQMAWNAENRLRFGKSYVQTGGVFVEASGQFYMLDTLSATARRTRDRLGLPKASAIHGLRHAYGRAMNASGAVDPKTLQVLMGHSRFETTYNLYVATGNDQLRNAMDVMAGLVDK